MALSHPFDKLRTGPFPSNAEGLRTRFPSPACPEERSVSKEREGNKGRGIEKMLQRKFLQGKIELLIIMDYGKVSSKG